jgi:L-iditol 2-dehydrogenase
VKAVIYYAYDDIRLEERAIPVIDDDELLVHVHGCGLCGSDILKIVVQAPPPVILGHELTGSIVQCGHNVKGFSEGDRVVVAHHVPCGACHYCRHQSYSMCSSFKASNIDPCGLAEYIRVPAEHVQHTTLLLPPTLSAEAGSFTEPLACCVRAVRRTPLLDGDTVVIMGLGSIGLLMLQAVKALNKRLGRTLRVYGVDLEPERLQLARSLGADHVFLAPANEQALCDLLAPHTQGRGADSIILAVAGTHPFQQAMAGLRKGGLLHIFAAHTGIAPINIEAIYQQELSIISTYSSSPEDLRIALDLLVNHEVQVERLISHHLPMAQFPEGITLMRERAALKVYFQIAGEIHGK